MPGGGDLWRKKTCLPGSVRHLRPYSDKDAIARRAAAVTAPLVSNSSAIRSNRVASRRGLAQGLTKDQSQFGANVEFADIAAGKVAAKGGGNPRSTMQHQRHKRGCGRNCSQQIPSLPLSRNQIPRHISAFCRASNVFSQRQSRPVVHYKGKAAANTNAANVQIFAMDEVRENGQGLTFSQML